jgi:hypothetical protein
MTSADSNIGISGPESVRVGGRRIENLPIAEAARAKDQIPAVYKTDLQNKIAAIKAKYPPAKVVYYESRTRECHENIDRVQKFSDNLRRQISEYTAQITMCKYRDKEIANIPEDDPDREEKIRDLKKRFPLYQVDAMEAQIVQFEEGCVRSEEVIKKENASIAELSEAIGLVKQRDLELKRLGA